MESHIKLLKIIEAKNIKRRKSLMVKYKDDKLLGELIELMASPEYNHESSLQIPSIRPQPTVPTVETFTKFRSLLFNKDVKVIPYIDSLDSATCFVYSHIVNQTDLDVEFRFIASNFNLFNRFNYNEHYIDYGFPKLPCHIQVIPKERQMVNIKVSNTVTATYLDGRYFKDISLEILEQMKMLHLQGDFTGYIKDDVYYITNFYPESKITFSKRIMVVEIAMLHVKLSHVKLIDAFTLTDATQLNNFLVKDHEVICKQDTLPVFGKSHNMMSLDCNRLIKLKRIKDEAT